MMRPPKTSISTGTKWPTRSSRSVDPKPLETRTTGLSRTSSRSSRPKAWPSGPNWAAPNVCFHDTGVKRLHHPVVGDLELIYEAMDLSADTGLTMFAYTAEPGSKSEQTLNLLGSWSPTTDQPELTCTTDPA